ncbi:MAG: hypothetical protein OIN86_07145 [Candidatus Methanoperedens sp.]|nr:hypothetical protein [Candidatus Methanoperedens sp.]
MKYDKVFHNCLYIIILFIVIYWATNFAINTKYLFGWDKIPGNDNGRLREYLEQNYGIDWVKTANISKINDNRTIIVSTENNSISLEINKEKTKINSKNDSIIASEFIVRTENGNVNVYYNPRTINIVLMLISVLLSVLLIRIIPKYKMDDFEIKGNTKLVIAYNIKFTFFIIFLLFLFFQLISLVSNKDGYYGSTWIIFSIGMILMSYPSNMEDIIYILHKLHLNSSSREVSSNWYYLFGCKIDKIFKNELLEDLRAFQRPLTYMQFLAAHSTFNYPYRRDKLKIFYTELLVYLLEKDFEAGAHAINSISNEIDEIKLLNQNGNLKSSSIGVEFNDLNNDSKMRMDRRSILLTHIKEKSPYSAAIIFLIGLLSIYYITKWFGGGY